MRSRLVRVRRKHARSMQLALLFFMLSLAIYLFSWATRAPITQTEPVSAPGATLAPTGRVQQQMQFEKLSCYLVELGRYDTPEQARIEAARYVRRGAAGYVRQDGEAYQVIGALYETQEQAEKIAARLTESEELTCRVIELTSQPIALRVTATQTQIDALSRTERCLREISQQMVQLGYQLDAGSLDIAGAIEQLQDLRTQATLHCQSLERAIGDDPNPIARDMLAQALTLSQSLEDRIAGSDTTALSFSAKIKYNTITVRQRHIDFLNSLGA